jgi:putative IMPACT (imprinted ancient) family translation regulator
MMEVLKRRGMTDVVAVVTRYFGGIKLGAGGLVRADGNAVSEALDRAQLVHRRALTQATIEVPHADAGRFDNLLREWVTHHDATLGETAYGQRALFEAWIPAEQLTQLTADIATWSQGTLTPAFGDTRVTDTPA